MYTYIHVCVCVCIIHTLTHAHTYIYIHTHIRIYMHKGTPDQTAAVSKCLSVPLCVLFWVGGLKASVD